MNDKVELKPGKLYRPNPTPEQAALLAKFEEAKTTEEITVELEPSSPLPPSPPYQPESYMAPHAATVFAPATLAIERGIAWTLFKRALWTIPLQAWRVMTITYRLWRRK
jgi:hypothetical protein